MNAAQDEIVDQAIAWHLRSEQAPDGDGNEGFDEALFPCHEADVKATQIGKTRDPRTWEDDPSCG